MPYRNVGVPFTANRLPCTVNSLPAGWVAAGAAGAATADCASQIVARITSSRAGIVLTNVRDECVGGTGIPACGWTGILACLPAAAGALVLVAQAFLPVVRQAILPVPGFAPSPEGSGRLGDGRNAVPLAKPATDRNVYPTNR